VLVTGDPACKQVNDSCATMPATDAAGHDLSTQAEEQQRPDGSWFVININCSVITNPHQVTGTMARQQAQRLVPHPSIGTAPPNGHTLVNIDTILWINTPTDQNLGTVTLLGQPVALRVHIDHITWTFGDHHGATTSNPEPPYNTAQPCTTAHCTHYWGHVYTDPGTHTITATTTWTGHYRVANGPWQTITGTVTGPPATTTITADQARSILVPNPTR
jgi:hypothetical protein